MKVDYFCIVVLLLIREVSEADNVYAIISYISKLIIIAWCPVI